MCRVPRPKAHPSCLCFLLFPFLVRMTLWKYGVLTLFAMFFPDDIIIDLVYDGVDEGLHFVVVSCVV